MFTFEWDGAKAASNRRKHGVSFDEAVTVFGDAGALTFADTDHADNEDRSRTYGLSSKAGCSSWSTRSGATMYASSVRERRRSMSKKSTKPDDQDIPELTREQLGRGVRGKYFKKFTQGSNVVVLRPELQKAFPTSQAVNDALTSYLAFAREAKSLTGGKTARTAVKRRAA
jgi:uncharacterized DUF497 family protein